MTTTAAPTETTNTRRRAVHAVVSDAAHDAWHDACAQHGVSVSAVLEILADDLDVILDPDTVAAVRRLDTERRRRHGRR